MQLRVARLCLDCEELHVDQACPRCASERYAFLSSWLPSEERRRWRPVAARPQHTNGVGRISRLVARWFSGEKPDAVRIGPATRASDYAAQLNFDAVDDKRNERRPLGAELSKRDVR